MTPWSASGAVRAQRRERANKAEVNEDDGERHDASEKYEASTYVCVIELCLHSPEVYVLGL